MNPIKSILERKIPPGVYQLDSLISLDRALELSKESKFGLFYLDGTVIDSGSAFADVVKEVLGYSYGGKNWNAVYDHFTDLGHLVGDLYGYLVIYTNFQIFAAKDKENFAWATQVMQDAAEFWSSTDTPMYFVLQGDRSAAPDLKSL